MRIFFAILAAFAVSACSTATTGFYGYPPGDAAAADGQAGADPAQDVAPPADVPAGSLKIGNACSASAPLGCSASYTALVHCDPASNTYKPLICTGSVCEYGPHGAQCKASDIPADTGVPTDNDAWIGEDSGSPTDNDVYVSYDTSAPWDIDVPDVPDITDATAGTYEPCYPGSSSCDTGVLCTSPASGVGPMCTPSSCEVDSECPPGPTGTKVMCAILGDMPRCVLSCNPSMPSMSTCPSGLGCVAISSSTTPGICGPLD